MAFRRVYHWSRFQSSFQPLKWKSLHICRKNFADDTKPKKDNRLCDDGSCPRYQMDMKQMLDRKEMEHLQPARSKFAVNTFSIARPHVPPVVNPELEEQCLQKKRCDDIKKGMNPDDNNRKTERK